MKRFKLSNSEEILMDTLWRENRPLTTLQLAEKVTEARWNTNYIDKLLGQLVKKGIAFFDKLKAAALCGGLFLRFSSLFPNNFP